MGPNLRGDDRRAAIEAILGEIDGDVLLVDPSNEAFRALVDYGVETDDDLPAISVLAREDVLKDVRDDFLVASDAADLVEAETLELRVLEGVVENTLVVGE